MLLARCRDPDVEVDHDWFFPTRGGQGNRAKAVCRKCPVQSDCDEYAERTGSEGVWAARVRNKRGKSHRV